MKRSFEALGDSSSSSSSTIITEQSNYKTKAFQVEIEVRHDLRSACFTDTPKFLETFFPILDDKIIDILSKIDNSLWHNFSDSSDKTRKEKSYYMPFVDLANAIHAACGKGVRPNRWLSDPHRSPLSYDAKAADLQPDIIAALGVSDDTSVESSVPTKIPWHGVLVPMEVKKDNVEKAAAVQLFTYIRQVLHESVDRRFVFGLVLADRNITVYLVDRSGVLGSTNFNMHDDRRSLIRLIAGFSLIDIDRLGWDTTMTVVHKSMTGNPLLSYQIQIQDDVHLQLYNKYFWRMVVHGIQPDKTVKEDVFILFHYLSFSRGEVILGRATRVWKAWREEDMKLPQQQRQLYIVKDTWGDGRRPFEGAIYRKLESCEGVAKIHSYGAVCINGEQDTTGTLIRRGLQHNGKPRDINREQEQVPKNISLTSPNTDYHQITKYIISHDYLPEIPDSNACPRSRTHSRLVIESYGWPIKFAKNLSEFVGAMRDTIIGHRNSFNKNVLHGDISIGNILITTNNERGHRGILIDYENAIELDRPDDLDDPSGTRPFMSAELLRPRFYFPYDPLGKKIDGVPSHSKVHDAEAFFWVLVWYCISRGAPTARRSELLSNDQDSTTDDLRQDFFATFESDDNLLATTKTSVFRSKISFRENLLCHISDYCRPLKPLVNTFYSVLADAYEYHTSDDLHEKVIDAFDKAEILVNELPEEHTRKCSDEQETEEARRAQDLPGRWDWKSPSSKGKDSAEPDNPSPYKSLPPDPGSPTPAGKRPKLTSGKGDQRERR